MDRFTKRICWTGNVALALLFLAILFVPLADSFLEIDHTVLKEKRQLAAAPAVSLSWQTLRNFPRQFDDFYRDHFGFRARLIRWLSIARTKGIGASGRHDVLIGKDEWLYYAPTPMVHSMRRTQPFTPRELAQWRNLIEEAHHWCRGHNIPFLFLVAPEKSTIYPEYLPDHLQPVGGATRMDQFFAYISANSDLPFLDVRGALLDAKAREQVYLRTDTHWTPAGSHVVYSEIIDRLRDWFPSLQPLPRDAFREKPHTAPGGDLAGMLGVPDWFMESSLLLPHIGGTRYKERPYGNPITKDFRTPVLLENPKGAPFKVILIRDSFGNRIKPFFGETFARTILLYPMKFDTAAIEKERPDVVIWEMAERNFTAAHVAEHPFAVQDFAAAIPPAIRREPCRELVDAWQQGQIGQAWQCAAGLKTTAAGVHIPPARKGPVLAWHGDLSAAAFSAVRITVDASGAPDRMRLFFARRGDIKDSGRPFANPRSVPFRRLDPDNPHQWTAVPSENDYWEADICRLSIGASVAADTAVTVTAIEFLR